MEQKLDFVTKGLRFEGRFGFDTDNQSSITRKRMPETWRAQRERDDNGDIILKQQSIEKPMEQTSSSTGDRREFFEAILQYNRAFKAHHLGGTLNARISDNPSPPGTGGLAFQFSSLLILYLYTSPVAR